MCKNPLLSAAPANRLPPPLVEIRLTPRLRAEDAPRHDRLGTDLNPNPGGEDLAVKQITEGYHTLTAYLPVDDAAAAIDWYTKAFNAKERMRMEGPGGSIGHAEIQIGDSVIMLSDPFPQSKSRPPKETGVSTSG